MTTFLQQVCAILVKDLRVEWRSREIIYTMLLFAVLVVVIFAFAMSGSGSPAPVIVGGVIWATIAFSGTLGLTRIFEREREGETITALLLSPVSRAALYSAKLAATVIYIGVTELGAVPLALLIFNLPVAAPGVLLALLALGTLGFAAVGSLFAAALMKVRSREVFLALLTYPIVTPVIVAGTKGTSALLDTPADLPAAWLWLQLLATFDLLFVSLALVFFGPLVASE